MFDSNKYPVHIKFLDKFDTVCIFIEHEKLK